MPDQDIDASLSRNERRQLRRLLSTIDELDEGDAGSLSNLLKKANTRILMAAFGNVDARRLLSPDEFTGWHGSILQALYAELRNRGVTYVPSLIDLYLPGAWWGLPPDEE
jgi:hypothetical protein